MSEAQTSHLVSANVERSEAQTIHPPSGRVARSEGRAVPHDSILISVVMPCLNESRTLAACITEARAGCETALINRSALAPGSNISRSALAHGSNISRSALAPGSGISRSALAPGSLHYEILIADNGSTDGSQEIAIANGARVIPVEQKGYGAALLGGFAAAQGKYIVMGDSDSSYDFSDIPKLIAKLEEGNDLVLGNRFAGGIQPNAMPWHHRYIGNPILSGLGRLLYRTPCRDWHCGLRAFDREKMVALQLQSTGMEFASEMVLRASQAKLRMAEVPTVLRPDGRDRAPHLRSVRDGLRHLFLLFSSSQSKLLEFCCLFAAMAVTLLVSFWFSGALFSRSPSAAFPALVELDENSFMGDYALIPCEVKAPEKITIFGAQTSCGCIWTEELPMEIEAGGQREILFTFDRRKHRSAANSRFELTVKLFLVGDAKPLETILAVTPRIDIGSSSNEKE